MIEPSATDFTPTAALSLSTYAGPVEEVARALLGCLLVSAREDGVTAGIIIETEGYGGAEDPASHASFRRNGVVQAMWGPPGTTYVYRAYGVYPCLNVVTGPDGEPAAVLIRALEPVAGVEIMAARMRARTSRRLASGPGKLGLALGVTLGDNHHPLDRPPLWIQPGKEVPQVAVGPRVGVRRGVEPLRRFGVPNHPALSRPFPTENNAG